MEEISIRQFFLVVDRCIFGNTAVVGFDHRKCYSELITRQSHSLKQLIATHRLKHNVHPGKYLTERSFNARPKELSRLIVVLQSNIFVKSYTLTRVCWYYWKAPATFCVSIYSKHLTMLQSTCLNTVPWIIQWHKNKHNPLGTKFDWKDDIPHGKHKDQRLSTGIFACKHCTGMHNQLALYVLSLLGLRQFQQLNWQEQKQLQKVDVCPASSRANIQFQQDR